MKTSSRKSYIDILGILAIALVIFNHTRGYLLYQAPNGGKEFMYMFLTMITSKCANIFYGIRSALIEKRRKYKDCYS